MLTDALWPPKWEKCTRLHPCTTASTFAWKHMPWVGINEEPCEVSYLNIAVSLFKKCASVEFFVMFSGGACYPAIEPSAIFTISIPTINQPNGFLPCAQFTFLWDRLLTIQVERAALEGLSRTFLRHAYWRFQVTFQRLRFTAICLISLLLEQFEDSIPLSAAESDDECKLRRLL